VKGWFKQESVSPSKAGFSKESGWGIFPHSGGKTFWGKGACEERVKGERNLADHNKSVFRTRGGSFTEGTDPETARNEGGLKLGRNRSKGSVGGHLLRDKKLGEKKVSVGVSHGKFEKRKSLEEKRGFQGESAKEYKKTHQI